MSYACGSVLDSLSYVGSLRDTFTTGLENGHSTTNGTIEGSTTDCKCGYYLYYVHLHVLIYKLPRNYSRTLPIWIINYLNE